MKIRRVGAEWLCVERERERERETHRLTDGYDEAKYSFCKYKNALNIQPFNAAINYFSKESLFFLRSTQNT
jgi:hypothetical protein